jgi:hypothetical protein
MLVLLRGGPIQTSSGRLSLETLAHLRRPPPLRLCCGLRAPPGLRGRRGCFGLSLLRPSGRQGPGDGSRLPGLRGSWTSRVFGCVSLAAFWTTWRDRGLTSGSGFDLSMEQDFHPAACKATLPGGPQRLTFGVKPKQSMEMVTLPCDLLRSTCGRRSHSMHGEVDSAQRLAELGLRTGLHPCLEKAVLPSGVHVLSLGLNSIRSGRRMALPSGLQCSTFAADFSSARRLDHGYGEGDSTLRPASLDLWTSSSSKLDEGDSAQRLAERGRRT